ncbi:MAG TPA: arginine repressor [Clostridia bacterium]|nr:arginine repressor [Clostridia bacterium]
MKAARQRKIKEIVKNQNISTQEELAEALKKEGFHVTQATISRDIKELQLTKIAKKDHTYVYGLPVEPERVHNEERIRMMMRELVTEINYSENLLIIKTHPGNAHGIASLIDGFKWPGVIGTLAGDDTIFCAIKPRSKLKVILGMLKSLME